MHLFSMGNRLIASRNSAGGTVPRNCPESSRGNDTRERVNPEAGEVMGFQE